MLDTRNGSYNHKGGCWFLNELVVHVALGPHGDLIQMLPAWREIHAVTGRKPVVVVSTEYAATLEGVNYVEPVPFSGNWIKDVANARTYATGKLGHCRVLAWWNDTLPVPRKFQGAMPLNCRGKQCNIDTRVWRSYGHSMWERAGFPNEHDMLTFPLVFDQRDEAREQELLKRLWPVPARRKPILLVNVTGISSPFGYWPELYPVVYAFTRDFHIVDLGKVRAHRVYDLLGIYDVAAGLITCDSATLHLAPASEVPYIAFTANGWVGSVPKGNCAIKISYSETLRRLPEVRSVLEQWARAAKSSMLVPQV